MIRRVPPPVLIGAGFLIGLFLASLDKLLTPVQTANPYINGLIETVDWIAPPLAGALLAFAILYGMRRQRMLEAERAATQVLSERLAGTERRQALWVVAAAVAHDLKNPLHNLQLLVEELGEEGPPERRAELLSHMKDNVARATERIGELARVGEPPSDEEGGTIDVSPALAEVRQRLLPSALLARTEIVVDCPRELRVRIARLAIRSAVENVAANALEALQSRGRGGRLSLRGRAIPLERVVELVVEDDGPGIPDSLRPRLFVPFAASHKGSTGLGLAIARALARAAGGDLVCTDASPGYTQFRFTFPLR